MNDDNLIDSANNVTRFPLTGGGPPTGGGDMERIAKLEAHMEHVQADVTDLRADMKDVRERLATLDTRLAALSVDVRHLPTKGWAVTIVMGMLAFIAALIAYQDQIKSFVN